MLLFCPVREKPIGLFLRYVPYLYSLSASFLSAAVVLPLNVLLCTATLVSLTGNLSG